MTTTLKFLHCTRKAEYLESAIQNGLMFTDHSVQFKFTDDEKEVSRFLFELLPIVNWRLKELGEEYGELPDDRRWIINSGLGSISGKIPMLCFSEVPLGKKIEHHGFHFGQYGLVVSRKWLEKNGGDRVAYVGEDGKFGRILAKVLGAFRALTLFKDSQNKVLFEGYFMPMILDLFSYVEQRRHLEEQEWRIAGEHGFMGGIKSTGARVPLPLSEIEYVLVRSADEIDTFNSLIEDVAKKNSFKGIKPKVLLFLLPPA